MSDHFAASTGGRPDAVPESTKLSIAGRTTILLECHPDELSTDAFELPSQAGFSDIISGSRLEIPGGQFRHFEVMLRGKALDIFVVASKKLSVRRQMRAHLARWQAEREAMVNVLWALEAGWLTVGRNVEGADELQQYLTDAATVLLEFSGKSLQVKLASVSYSELHGGYLERLETELQRARGTVYRRVRAVLESEENAGLARRLSDLIREGRVEVMVDSSVNKTVVHGDNFGVAGVGNSGNEVTNASHNLEAGDAQLITEMAQLIQAMRKRAETQEQMNAVGQLTAALMAAEKQDKPSVAKFLAGAGKWAWEVAKEIGAQALAEALVKSGA